MTMNSNENEAKKPNITFELNENESQAARDFMREPGGSRLHERSQELL